MARRSILARIDDMLEMIDLIRKTEVVSDETPRWMARMAMERAFAIISEASRHIPEELKRSEPDIPWRDIAGIGNVLRHDYQAVSEDVLRITASSDLNKLEQALSRIKASKPED